MFALTWKGLWAHKLRFALTGLAVVLGVAFLSGTQILTDTMGRTFDGIFEDANQGVDVVVRRAAAVEGDFVEVRERVDTATLERVRAVDGVDAAVGSIEGRAALVGPDGKAYGSQAFGSGVIGANWIEDRRLNPFTIATGRAPRAPTRPSSTSRRSTATTTSSAAPSPCWAGAPPAGSRWSARPPTATPAAWRV